MELIELRTQISKIDRELVALFSQRMQLSAMIAEYKKANNLPVYIPSREHEVLNTVQAQAGPKMAEYTQKLFAKILELSKDYQEKVMHEVNCPGSNSEVM